MATLRNIIRPVIQSVLNPLLDRFERKSPVFLKIEYDGVTQFAFKFKAPSTSTLDIYDGDGTMTAVAGNAGALVTHSTTYATAGTYYFYVEGNVLDITQLTIANQSFVSGDISRYAELLYLDFLIVNDTGVSGDISGFSVLTVCRFMGVSRTNVTGDISGWTTMTNLLQAYFGDTGVEGDVSGWRVLPSLTHAYFNGTNVTFDSNIAWTNAVQVDFWKCGFTTEMVDNVLSALSASATVFINLAGNSERSVGSDSDLITLVQANAIVVVEEATNIGTLGAELHTDANAISDPNSNEADATIGWTPTSLTGTGANVFESQQSVKHIGASAFHMDSNDTPTNGSKIAQSFTTVTETVHRLLFAARHDGIGGIWRLEIDDAKLFRFANTYTDFEEFIVYCKSTSVALLIEFEEMSFSGGMYVDDLSLKPVTLP